MRLDRLLKTFMLTPCRRAATRRGGTPVELAGIATICFLSPAIPARRHSDEANTMTIRKGSATLDATRADALRSALLEVHHAVVECERRAYEKEHGRQTGAEFLQVVAYDDAYRWLSPLSRLIVELDEGIEDAADNPEPVVRAVADRARSLLRRDPDPAVAFSQRYAPLIDASPDVALAHGRMQSVLRDL